MQNTAINNELELLIKFKSVIFYKKEQKHKTNPQKFVYVLLAYKNCFFRFCLIPSFFLFFFFAIKGII